MPSTARTRFTALGVFGRRLGTTSGKTAFVAEPEQDRMRRSIGARLRRTVPQQ